MITTAHFKSARFQHFKTIKLRFTFTTAHEDVGRARLEGKRFTIDGQISRQISHFKTRLKAV